LERGAVSDPALAYLGRQNVVWTYVELARALPGAIVERREAFVSCIAPISLSFCNFALDFDAARLAEPEEIAHLDDLTEGCPSFRAFHLPYREDDPVPDILAARGWKCQHSLVQMGWTPEPGETGPPLRPCEARPERLAVAEFMVDQFFWRQEPDMKRIILEATVDSCHELWRFGEPDIDAAVMTTRTAGSIGLYNLCVRRALRGAGLGSALVRSVQSMGREDAVPVVLQCDTVLEAWYRQLDFKKTGILESYARYR
jgi:GNAT superfamily N-acetyltransferase